MVLIFLAGVHVSLGQGPADKWYFGQNVGIDFTSGAAVLLTNSDMYALEGSASIADINGDLLFYSDGDTVWNKKPFAYV